MNAPVLIDTRLAYKVLFPLIRQRLWAPDGLPPPAWDERREGSVIKRLLIHRSQSQIEVAVLGLAQLRDEGSIDWLRPGQKVTMRALYHTRSGVSQMFELATSAYWRAAKHRPKRSNMSAIGDILMHSLRQSADYKAYMRSPKWRARREQVLARAAYRCERCGLYGRGLEVHHLRYDNLGHESDSDLEVLCLDCHPMADAQRAAATFGGSR
jgi:5-methylcytosine-specific restriction endonuclease McrA